MVPAITLNKFQALQKSHDDAIASIKRRLVPGECEPHFEGLAAWIMYTDANPYSYLESRYAVLTKTAEGLDSLFHTIGHALHDDGEIYFVSVNGEPRIVFDLPDSETFRDNCLRDMKKSLVGGGRTIAYEIEVLDIRPNDFGKVYDEYQKKDIRRCFMMDAGSGNFSIEDAAKHYRGYRPWQESWVEECREEIEIRRSRRKALLDAAAKE